MTRAPKRSKVLQLAGTVWPGKEADGYANLIAARLRKLAAAESTGVLPVSGRGDGAIFFRGGQVIYAESSRTPAQRRLVQRSAGWGAPGVPRGEGPRSAPRAGSGELVLASRLGRLAGLLSLAEPIFDAATELLSSESRYAKFRPFDVPPSAQVRPIPMKTLLTEVERRRRLLHQLSAVVTADTPVIRSASLSSSRLQVSPPQWALVVRADRPATPRALAMGIGQSVFATTIEAYRLLTLGLLVVPGPRAAPAVPAGVMSFIRAVSDERH